jgi:hypothetical protein
MALCLVVCPNKHITCYQIKSKDAVLQRVKEKKIICPRCGGNLSEYKPPKWHPAKQFFCRLGHVTSIYPFTNGECNIAWSDKDYINADINHKEIENSIKSGDICCPIINDKHEVCGLRLVPVDNVPLEPAKLSTAKTVTRLGDLWDRAGYPEPKHGTYDADFNYHESEFQKRNRQRLKNLKKERLTKPAGEIISKPTRKSYRETHHRKPSQDEI